MHTFEFEFCKNYDGCVRSVCSGEIKAKSPMDAALEVIVNELDYDHFVFIGKIDGAHTFETPDGSQLLIKYKK